MREITLLRRGAKRCAYQLRNLLSKATDANCVVIAKLNSDFLTEYDEQLKERGQDASPYMPQIGGWGEGYHFEGESDPEIYYPRWFAAHDESTNADGNPYFYPIEAPRQGLNHTFDEIERRFSMLKAWELLLVWQYEFRVRKFRESILGFEDLIAELQNRVEEPFDTDVPDIDDVCSVDLISR